MKTGGSRVAGLRKDNDGGCTFGRGVVIVIEFVRWRIDGRVKWFMTGLRLLREGKLAVYGICSDSGHMIVGMERGGRLVRNKYGDCGRGIVMVIEFGEIDGGNIWFTLRVQII